MSRNLTIPLQAGFRIRMVVAERSYPRAVEKRVDEVWDQLTRERPGELHDGSLATLERATPAEILVGRVPYRYYAAQRADPSLLEPLDLWCVGVAGVTRAGDHLLFGRRAAVAQYRGWWELVPSGHLPIDIPTGAHLNPVAQLLEELEEEVGISALRVSKISPLALIPDPTICVSDVFMTLALDLTAPELEMAVANAPRAEYDRVISVPSGGLAAFLVEHSGRVLASTRIALDLLADH